MVAIENPIMSGWDNFYVIVGSSAAALIGLQFVVIALIADIRRPKNADAIKAFGTPTVVHLGGALVLSSVISAPWRSIIGLAATLLLTGAIGLAYVGRAIYHA